VSRDDLIERAGVLPSAKLSEIEDALRLSGQVREWTPATAAKFSEMRNASVPADSNRREGTNTPDDIVDLVR
jgi:hypothetical protein